MSEFLSRRKWLILEIVVLLLLLGTVASSLYAVGNYEYSQGYSNGHVDGYRSGYAVGYKQGHVDGYQSGYALGENDGYSRGESDGYQNGYSYGEAYIECWVIQNHPIVYFLWFNDAFAGVTCS